MKYRYFQSLYRAVSAVKSHQGPGQVKVLMQRLWGHQVLEESGETFYLHGLLPWAVLSVPHPDQGLRKNDKTDWRAITYHSSMEQQRSS
eukprot:1138457-Pelagomonas_calceolata.AAC.4